MGDKETEESRTAKTKRVKPWARNGSGIGQLGGAAYAYLVAYARGGRYDASLVPPLTRKARS